MHFHHYTLKRLAALLNRRLKGQQIIQCWSQNRNELVVEFDNLILRAGCHTPLTYLVPVSQYAKARKNTVPLFEEIRGASFLNAEVVPYDRVLILKLSGDWSLVFLMHGIQANVLLVKNKRVEAHFLRKKNAPEIFAAEPGPWKSSAIEELDFSSPKSAGKTLKAVSPIFDRFFAARATELAEQGRSAAEVWTQLQEEAQAGPVYIGKQKGDLRFLLFPLSGYEPLRAFDSIENALDQYLRWHFQFNSYREIWRNLEQRLFKPYRKLQKSLTGLERSRQKLIEARDPEEFGHIIMANLQQIKPGVKTFEAEDFYRQGQIKIKLDPKLNPQENAERYYRKQKKRRSQLAAIDDQIVQQKKELEEMAEVQEAFLGLPAPEDLVLGPKGFDRQYLEGIRELEKTLGRAATGSQKQGPPFRSFERHGWQIFVGRNARNSDELTFHFAHKEDLWLHARDVPGSHVIIRRQGQRDLPPDILEYAAGLAAFYSKAKHNSLVPVQYTPRKYVRKRKGDPPGLVAVDREEVIIVEPVSG